MELQKTVDSYCIIVDEAKKLHRPEGDHGPIAGII